MSDKSMDGIAREITTNPVAEDEQAPGGPVFAGHRALLTGKPPAEVSAAIIQEIYRALTALGADSPLLGTVGSWGDTMTDEQVLAGLRAWNAGARVTPSMKEREPERQRGLLTDEEWAMVDLAAAPATATATAKGQGGLPS